MSRYVDLDGLTWDGKPISSKIQEVKTKSGYMQGITVGWLWGDNVPHIDLAEHDNQIRNDVVDEFLRLCDAYCHFSKDKHPNNGYVISRASLLDIVHQLKDLKS